ncbi:DUF6197 family protein [Candidatus Frankia alpina]|uniref:DUF6197 family protein n=1 Tax=Candidatus Frankia alpina TaxID=2699483 RepID=UPI0013CFB170|nr:hypothetical protein [Candidatus Frankia alpina]
MTTIPTTVAALLRAARDELDRRGWTQHDFEAPTGEVCLLGALNASLTRDPRHGPATVAAQRLLVAAAGTLTQRLVPTDHADEDPEELGLISYPIGEITEWNDADGRTLEQVVALLDTTASELDAASETDGRV